jgi:hypothetical protein
VVAAGKGMAAEMTRDLYRVMGRLDDFAIDADILVEMYVVNTSREKHFIRDFTATVEVDGKTLPLVRQSDSAQASQTVPCHPSVMMSGWRKRKRRGRNPGSM